METNLDQKQLLVLGYLRKLLNDANLEYYQLGGDDDEDEDDFKLSPIITPTLSPMTKFDEHMQLFNLGIPQFQLRSNSLDSVASDLSDHDLTKYDNFNLPLTIIQFVYLYFNRYQNYLLLLGGSEECKNNSYNQIQIINLRNISDIQQNIEYPYTNYRLKPHLWREKINYTKYFNIKSSKKYLKQSKSIQCIATPEPILVHPVAADSNNKGNKSKDNKGNGGDISVIKITASSPKSPWSSMNSPYSPFAKIAATVDGDDGSKLTPINGKLSPFAQINALKSKPRSKSHGNLDKLQKKDIKKMKTAKNVKIKSKSKAKTVSMKRRKSAVKIKSISPTTSSHKKKKKLIPKKPKKMMKRHSTMLPGFGSKALKKKSNAITNNRDFDKYSFGECIVPISSDKNGGILPKWPWLTAKYKAEIKRDSDNLEFAKYKMYIRCGGILTKDDEYTNDNDLIFFNATNLNDIGREIDAFYCKLPAFKQRLESPSIIYNDINNLLSFGGYSYDDGKAIKSIYSLNLNTKRSKFKWRKYGCLMNKPRYESSVTHIINRSGKYGQNKFIIIGGKGSSTKPIADVEMFDSSKTTKESKCTQLTELNFPRFKPGSCKLNGDTYNSSKIAVCGGILYGKGADRVEIYDLNKDKWMVHHTPLQFEHQHPDIWNEIKEINPNILYVAGNNVSFGAKKGSLGYIEWTDLRIKDKKFNLLYKDSIEELFEFWGLRPNIWEPRSLLHFLL